MEPIISTTTVRKKRQPVDYTSAEITQNAHQIHLRDTSTQTALAGHVDSDRQQIFNPPRDPPTQRKIDYAERNQRRKRNTKKKLKRSPEEQRKLEETRKLGNFERGSGEDEALKDNTNETENKGEEDNDSASYEDEAPESDTDIPSGNALLGLMLQSPVSGVHLQSANAITPPPQHLERLLNALETVGMPLVNMDQIQGLIQHQLRSIRAERDICEDLEDKVRQLQEVTNAITSEVDALQEGLVTDRLNERERLIRDIRTLRVRLSMLW